MLVLTTFDLDEYVFRGLRAGASGFLLKDIAPEELVHAIRVVRRGSRCSSPSVTRRLIEEFVGRPRRRPAPPPGSTELTEREREVLALVAAGLANRGDRRAPVLSPATVKTHVSRVFSKLQLRDRAQAVVLAYETGLVRPHDAGPATATVEALGVDPLGPPTSSGPVSPIPAAAR